MMCDVCRERDASVHLTRVVQGEVTLQYLCPKCAAELGIETVASTPQTVLGEVLNAVQQQGNTNPLESVHCSLRGKTLKDLRSTGSLGCARCYDACEASMRELLRKVHGNAQHVGRKYVAPMPEISARASTLGELRDRLRRAIDNEEFELAASIRDKLKGHE